MKKRRAARAAILNSRLTVKSKRNLVYDNGVRNNAIQLLAHLPPTRAGKIEVLDCAKSLVLSIYDRDRGAARR